MTAADWTSYVEREGRRVDRMPELLEQAAEACAAQVWRAACNGSGKVDAKARKLFDAARDDVAADRGPRWWAPESGLPIERNAWIVDAIAGRVQRAARRTGKAEYRVDGVTYGVQRVQP